MIGTHRLVLFTWCFTVASCSLLSSTNEVDLSAKQFSRQLEEIEMSMPGKGKGSKSSSGSAKLSKSSKSPSSGKGKGKGKGTSTDTGKGKGGKGGEMSMPSKGSKSESSKGKGKGSKVDPEPPTSKSVKTSKKGGKGEGGGGGPGPSPSSPPGPATPSPTSENSFPIRATPYALFYTLGDQRIPSTDEYSQLAELTRQYLEEVMIDEFSQTSLTNLDDFLTFMIRNSYTIGQPVQVDYRSTGLFNPSSIFLPTVRELNQLIEAAFSGDNLDIYLELVQDLPSSNILSTTTSVSFGPPDTSSPRSSTASSTGGGATAAMVAAAAGIVVLAAGAILMKRSRTPSAEQGVEEHEQNLKGDSTVAEETCAMSLDDGSTWRKDSPYADSRADEEFEDEPLDNGNEQEVQNRQSSRIPPRVAFTSS